MLDWKQGFRDRTSYVLRQDKIRFVLTSALHPDSEIAEHVKLHGDGVKDLAMWVDDTRRSFEETVETRSRTRYASRGA